MNSFNLIDSPWIPVRNLDGTSRLMSLDALFREAAAIANLDCAPHERISLMRLLVCITQAALGAPDSPDDWRDFGHDFNSRIPEYLRRSDIHRHFNLFGDGPRFLQIPIAGSPDPVSASKLIPHLATGNNSTLLDHEGSNEKRAFAPARLASALLSFQCFYPLYGAGYKGKGPCVDGNMLHTLIVGNTLGESILSNCLSQDYIDEYFHGLGVGRPIWELDPGSKNYSEMATRSYLGRLVPRHRNLWLLEDGTGFFLQQQSMEYPRYEEAREPSATVVVITKKDQQERRLLPARLDKATWRDLHAVAVLRESRKQEACAPLILHAQFMRMGDCIHLWTGGFVTDLKAKIHDTVESSFTAPVALFTEHGRACYQAGVEFAEKQSNHLYGAVRQYGAAMKNNRPPTERAKQHYWNALDLQAQTLLDLVPHAESRTESFGEADNPWTQAVRRAAARAYEQTCPRQTPRQIQAFAAGLRVLNPVKKATKKPQEKTAAA